MIILQARHCLKYANKNQTMKIYRGREGIVNVGTRCRLVVSFTFQSLHLQAKIHRYELERRLMNQEHSRCKN